MADRSQTTGVPVWVRVSGVVVGVLVGVFASAVVVAAAGVGGDHGPSEGPADGDQRQEKVDRDDRGGGGHDPSDWNH